MVTQLSRSRTDMMVAGVCSGLARILEIDVAVIRLFFVLMTLGGGAGVLVYVVLWMIMPLEGEGEFGSKATAQASLSEIADHARTVVGRSEPAHPPSTNRTLLIAATLIIIGAMTLLRTLGIPWMTWLHMGTIWPLLLIVGGIAMLARRATEV